MVDLRGRVEEDRGLLKRIQLKIPGFAGYRRREDLRDADIMLRIQVANMLKDVRAQLEESRAALTSNYQLKALEPLGAVIMKIQGLEGQVRHAESGYSPMVTDIKVLEPQLNRLYEWDASLLDGVDALNGHAASLLAATSGDGEKVTAEIEAMRKAIGEMEATFKRRMLVITGTEVL